MCKTPCCPPQHSSGTGAIVAIIGVIIAISVLRAILGLLELLAIITLTTVAATAVVALAIWTVKHHRETAAARYTLQQARRAPALPPRYVLAIGNQPADQLTSTTTPRALASQHEHAIRQFAEVISAYDDPAAVDDLIHRALRGPDTQPQFPRGHARNP
jgi:hypothetical protein